MIRSRIPAHLHAPLLGWLGGAHDDGRPRTQQDGAAWLLSEHGVRVSRMAVTRLVAARHERGEALVVEALREELRDAVRPALIRVRRASKALDAALAGKTDIKTLAVATRAQVEALEALAKLAGVAAPVAVDLTSGGQTLRVYLPDEEP
ncbi:MAG: hypothetical protein JNK72_00295 [Myxococcales bacterium]|nr:hypothetical protein [Myxococcales bacterium]